MLYQISRAGQTYGPYTLADLNRYVASGHVLLTDLAKGDESSEWVSVSAILNPSAATAPPAPLEPAATPEYQAAYAPPGYVPVTLYQDPPNLHWGLVLLFDILTLSFFQLIWNLILSTWVKRVQRNSQATLYYLGGYGLVLLSTGLSLPVYVAMMNHAHYSTNTGLSLLGLIAWVLRLVARFNMKQSLEEHFNTLEPIGLRMSGVLTFFFGGLYIQSQLNRINDIKQAMRYQQHPR